MRQISLESHSSKTSLNHYDIQSIYDEYEEDLTTDPSDPYAADCPPGYSITNIVEGEYIECGCDLTYPAEEVDEGFGGELTGEDKKKFEQWRKDNAEQLGYELTGTSDIKESVNERISVSDERHFGKKGIIIMIDDNGKKVSAIFKDKKNANKFNRNKPADIKKLLQLAKKTKYPKAIDESVNEAVEPTGNIKKVLDVAKNKQAKKIGGTLVDLTTSSMMTQVWDKVNDSSKEKMNKMNTKQLINLILKLWDRMGTPRV